MDFIQKQRLSCPQGLRQRVPSPLYHLAEMPSAQRLCEAASVAPRPLVARYGSSFTGLRDCQIKRRRHLFGANALTRRAVDSWPRRLLRACINPFSLVLLTLAAISFVTDYCIVAPEQRDLRGVVIVSLMVGAGGLLRFVQENRSSSAAQRLQDMVTTSMAVVRQRIWRELPIEELVVGDVVRLAAGDMIPADVRLLEAKDFFVSQSSLTGESEPVEKFVAPLTALPPGPQESPNLAFMSSNVVSGTALALVVAVGDDTMLGALARTVAHTDTRTNFEKGVNDVSWVLIRFMLSMAPIVLLLNGFTKGDWLEATLFALSVAVGLTPEMLPMLVSANLARGAALMSRRKVIVKRLNAIQNLGAMDILCTDKTGTLTQDKIVLEYSLDVHGSPDNRVLRHAFLNSYHQTGLKSLMDVAIVSHADERNMIPLWREYRKEDEIPFDFVRRRMSVMVADPKGKTQIITKGAVDEMLSVCSFVEYGGAVAPLTPPLREEIRASVRRYNQDGLRVVAVAHKSVLPKAEARTGTRDGATGAETGACTVADETDMVLLGYLAFLDPPKESARPAMERLAACGVGVKVLTGDNEAVTRSICRQVGIGLRDGATLLTGPEIEALNDDALSEKVEEARVFARLTPLQKARIVTCLRHKGHTVGFLGDGINDAPAMRAADVGISVDTAVDIAKESADIILLEKSLLVLEEGCMAGRRTYGNIIKYIKITTSSNFGNMFSVLAAGAMLPFLPMAPLQLLVLNMIYDISCTAIPWDRVDADFVRQPRTWEAGSINRFMLWLGPVSSIFDITTFLLLYHWICPLMLGGAYPALPPAAQAQFAALFQSGWFVESLWSQMLVIHVLRTARFPFVQSRPSWQLACMTGAGMAVGTALPFSSFGPALGMLPLPADGTPWLLGTMLAYILLASLVKMIFLRRYKALL